MVDTNHHYKKLKSDYLFYDIEKKALKHKNSNPNVEIIDLGIGDATIPIPEIIISHMCEATKRLGDEKTFLGYGPSVGYDFLKEKIIDNDYKNINISKDEIFISNGIKSDIANIQELFSSEAKIGLCDPSYPVYADSNVMAGRSKGIVENGQYHDFIYLPCLEENNFSPTIPSSTIDLIYLCSPNNPTGCALTKKELQNWVDFAKENNSIIFFDGAYEAFITSDNVPRSIYSIPGAEDVAVEFRSFSKTAGFTNLRASYCTIPKNIKINGIELNQLWKRRQITKFGGIPYPIQKGVEAIYSKEGKKATDANLSTYKQNAKIIIDGLKKLNFKTFGGIDSPYVWIKTPKRQTSWQFFDELLLKANIICIPGSGFGPGGEGFVRFSSFAKREKIEKALINLGKMY
jgi:LL-diaminopimelate aminotransferase